MGKITDTCNLTLPQVIMFLAIIQYSSSSRTISNPTPKTHHQYADHSTITFLMRNVLNGIPSPKPANSQFPGDQLPFPKPLGLFPPAGGIPLPGSNPETPATSSPLTEPLDFPNPSFSFPTIATLQELELVTVTEVYEYLYRDSAYNMEILGRAKGAYVASSEDGSSHMMAMTVYFSGDQNEDALRFFGVHRKDVLESHIAVIGGSGKHSGANGYATIKSSVGNGFTSTEKERMDTMYLSFTVYLS